MYILLVLALSVVGRNASANCELERDGYHTVASYAEGDTVKGSQYLYYDLIDPYWYFRIIPLSNIEKKDIKRPKETMIDLVFENKSCQENVKPESIDYFIRTPVCKDVVLNNKVQHKGFALFETIKNKIHIPVYLKGQLVSNPTGREKNIAEMIEGYFKKSDFWLSQNQIITSEKMKIAKISHFHFNSKFSSSTVEVEGQDKGTFFVVFLIANDSLWYIADSSGLTKCDSEPDLAKDRKGMTAHIEEGWDYNADDIPDLIRFKEHDIYYHIEFGKEMLVLKDMTARTVMRHNQDHGLKPKK
jgi:hypothetical protein